MSTRGNSLRVGKVFAKSREQHVGDSEDETELSESMLDEEEQDVVHFWKKFLFTPQASLIIVILWFMLGIIVGDAYGDYETITSVYVLMQVLTTVGYGDVSVPENMHFALSVYCFLGLAIVAKVLNDFSSAILEGAYKRMQNRIAHVEALANEDIINAQEAETRNGKINKLVVSFVLFLVFLFGGAIFYWVWEPCSCSYGVTAREGCREDGDDPMDTCAKTGGQIKEFHHAFYMSMITLSTVGFGDVSPQSQVGRIFAIPWMLAGVLSTANFISALSDFIDWMDPYKSAEAAKPKHLKKVFDKELFDQIDLEKTGYISKAEFRCWMLLKLGVVQQEDIDSIDQAFNKLDANKTGKLEFELLHEQFGAHSCSRDKKK